MVRFYKCKRLSSFCITLTCIYSSQATAALSIGEQYQIAEVGNNLFLNSPYGSRVYFGDMGLQSLQHYELVVNIEDLRLMRKAREGGEPGDSSDSSSGNSNKSDAFKQDDSILIVKANELYNKGEFTESMKYVEEMLRRNRANTRGWVMKGSLFHAMGEKDLAKQAWEQAQALEPDNQEIQSILENY